MPHIFSRNQRKQHTPKWIRQRSVGNECHDTRVPLDSMQRIKLEATLDGHLGCVNCLQWNSCGDILLSGSDDCSVIMWDPFKRQARNIIKTKHCGNIFSVKFIQDFCDNTVATCGSDGSVNVTNVITRDNSFSCNDCHKNRVKRLEVHPNQPNLLWSAGEDGCIMQYDLREPHVCSATRPKNLLIDLKQTSMSAQSLDIQQKPPSAAKCLALNPMRDEMLAVGSNDIYVRLFDRRYVRHKSLNSCIANFCPGHLTKPDANKSSRRSFGATYLTFSQDGSEILVNLHGEQIYLYNTYEPIEEYKSFDTIRPLLVGKNYYERDDTVINNNYRFIGGENDDEISKTNASKGLKTRAIWSDLQIRFDTNYESPKKYRDHYMAIVAKLSNNESLNKHDFDLLNEMIFECEDCAEFYLLRASGLLNRDWLGDNYQAVRDCLCALVLKPRDITAVRFLLSAINSMGDSDAVDDFVEFLKTDELGDSILSFDETADMSDISHMGAHRVNCDAMRMYEYLFDGQTIRLNPYVMNRNCITGFHDKEKNGYRSRKQAHDYSKRFCGHCNSNTDIKEANFFGFNDEFIVAGSDDGAFYIWDKTTTNLVKAVQSDMHILNCIQPHPSICMLATSGIEPVVRLWSPIGKSCHDVRALEQRCNQNQEFISTDPMEAMIMMLYPSSNEVVHMEDDFAASS